MIDLGDLFANCRTSHGSGLPRGLQKEYQNRPCAALGASQQNLAQFDPTETDLSLSPSLPSSSTADQDVD